MGVHVGPVGAQPVAFVTPSPLGAQIQGQQAILPAVVVELPPY
jgi:hypothetical protein